MPGTLIKSEHFNEGTATAVATLSSGALGSFDAVSGSIRGNLVETGLWAGLLDTNDQYGQWTISNQSVILAGVFRFANFPRVNPNLPYFSACDLMALIAPAAWARPATVSVNELGNLILTADNFGGVGGATEFELSLGIDYFIALEAVTTDGGFHYTVRVGIGTAVGGPITWSALVLTSFVRPISPQSNVTAVQVGCITSVNAVSGFQLPCGVALIGAALYTVTGSGQMTTVPVDLPFSTDAQRSWHWSKTGSDSNAGDDAARPVLTAAMANKLLNSAVVRQRSTVGDILAVDDGGTGMALDSYIRHPGGNITLQPETGRTSMSLWGFKPLTGWTQAGTASAWELTTGITSYTRMFESRVPMVTIPSTNTRTQAISLLHNATICAYWNSTSGNDTLVHATAGGNPNTNGSIYEGTRFFTTPDGAPCLLELTGSGGAIIDLTTGGTAIGNGSAVGIYNVTGAGSGTWALNGVRDIFGAYHGIGIVTTLPSTWTLTNCSTEQCVNSNIPLVMYAPQGIASASMVASGSGYTSCTVAIAAPVTAGGTTALAKGYIGYGGAITHVTVYNPGAHYAQGEVPVITITGAGGAGAQYTAVPVRGINGNIVNHQSLTPAAVEGSAVGTGSEAYLSHSDVSGINHHVFGTVAFTGCNFAANTINFIDDNVDSVIITNSTYGSVALVNTAVLSYGISIVLTASGGDVAATWSAVPGASKYYYSTDGGLTYSRASNQQTVLSAAKGLSFTFSVVAKTSGGVIVGSGSTVWTAVNTHYEPSDIVAAFVKALQTLPIDPALNDTTCYDIAAPAYLEGQQQLVIQVCPGAVNPDGPGKGSQEGGALERTLMVTVTVWLRLKLDPHRRTAIAMRKYSNSLMSVCAQIRQLMALTWLGDVLTEPVWYVGESATESYDEDGGVYRRDIMFTATRGDALPIALTYIPTS
jgi:hypothetical protein